MWTQVVTKQLTLILAFITVYKMPHLFSSFGCTCNNLLLDELGQYVVGFKVGGSLEQICSTVLLY